MENDKATNRANNARGKQDKSKRKKKIILIILIVLAILGAAVATAGTIFYKKAEKVITNKLKDFDYVDLSDKDLDIDPKVVKDLDGYKNIVLLGIDTRKGEDDETCRSDAIIIVTINKKTYEMNLTSVTRDSYLDIEEEGNHRLDKVTHAHAYGGPVNTIRALNRNLDLNIDSYMRVNWTSVAYIVNEIGGITVNVRKNEVAELNRVIKMTAEHVDGDYKLIKESGKHKLNGIEAVAYCRIRKGASGGDPARAARMRIALKKIFGKARKMSISELCDMADKVLPEIQTSICPEDMLDLLKKNMKYDFIKSETWPYNYDGIQLDNGSGAIWYDAAITLESNVKTMHEKLFAQSDYTPTDRVLEYSKRISSETGYYSDEKTDDGAADGKANSSE